MARRAGSTCSESKVQVHAVPQEFDLPDPVIASMQGIPSVSPSRP